MATPKKFAKKKIAKPKTTAKAKPRKKTGPRPGKGPGGFTIMYGS
jgi:hypothetical protein